jgi:hypothetical protein
MFLQPVAEGGIEPGLPTATGVLEGGQDIVVEPDGCRFFRAGAGGPTAQGLFCRFVEFFFGDDLFADPQRCIDKNSSVNSGASSGSTQELGIFAFFAIIGVTSSK